MKSLSHNGIMITDYEPMGFHILFKGKKIELTPKQEEMAVAWVKKLGTDYVNDKVFIKNFFKDFKKALGIGEGVTPEDFDFSEIINFIEKERERKENMLKEEKKKLAAERKAKREANKEIYGYAVVNGKSIEIANYTAEPSSIFMGRGKHPLRGKWKEGPKQNDIILNLSPDSKVPPGNWKKIVWDANSMWIASWYDKLSEKKKYVWFSDSSPIKQKKEIKKFDKSIELEENLQSVHDYIIKNLDSEDLKRRKLATVCYLIDALCMRVGDEKDEDEANTVGATTLTRENITILPNNMVKFDFLGKDYVRWEKEVKLPENVVRNLKKFIEEPNDVVFNGIRSEHVNAFLSEAMDGLTTKVFRTCNATKAVRGFLKEIKAKKDDPEYYKKHMAKMSNLEAAKICNHKRTIPKSWGKTLQRKKERLEASKNKSKKNMEKYQQKIKDMKKNYEKKIKNYEKSLEEYEESLKKLENQDKESLKKRITLKRKTINNQKARIKNLKKKYLERLEKLKQNMKKRKQLDQANTEKLKLQIEEQQKTRDYNLNTSLKSYVDPRVYKKWAKKVDYDWKKYYSKSLQKKFSWLDSE